MPSTFFQKPKPLAVGRFGMAEKEYAHIA